MNQAEVGKFIAALRKEKKLTQKQLAEILGVNDRSVSRWENGYCMPDLSLMQMISAELGISISELFNGRRMTDEVNSDELHDAIDAIIALSEKEKQEKAKKINHYFLAGLVCFAIVIFYYQLGNWFSFYGAVRWKLAVGILFGIGLLFEAFGFYYNQHDKAHTNRELELLSKKGGIRMRTTGEMLQFAGKYNEINKKQYELGFTKIESSLEEGEEVIFSAVGNSYLRNELPMLWHVAFAVTKDRIMISGERMKGVIMTGYEVYSFPVSDIRSVSIEREGMSVMLVIQAGTDELKIEESNQNIAGIILEELQKHLHSTSRRP